MAMMPARFGVFGFGGSEFRRTPLTLQPPEYTMFARSGYFNSKNFGYARSETLAKARHSAGGLGSNGIAMSLPSDNASSGAWRDASAGEGLPALVRDSLDNSLPRDHGSTAEGQSGACIADGLGTNGGFDQASRERPRGLPRAAADDVPVHASQEATVSRSGPRNHVAVDGLNAKSLHDRVLIRVPSGHAVSKILAESDRLETAASRILEAIGGGLGCETGAAWCVDRAANQLVCVAAWTSAARQAPEFERICRATTFAPGSGLAGRAWTCGQPVWIADLREDSTLPHVPMAAGEGLHSALALPIRRSEVVAVIEFFGRDIPQPDRALQEQLDAVGGLFGEYIELKRSERAAIEHDIEMRLAQKIKQDLLPRSVPRFPGFKIGNVFRAAPQTGGDYLDFVSLPDKSWVVAIGDASGHGVEAALLMAQTRAYLRALALGHTDVGKMLTLMNRRLVEDTLEEHYVTLFLARVLPESRSLVYSNAGHLPGFLLDAEGRLKKILPCTGIPLGLDSNILYSKEAGISLQNGDRLLLFTDGVSEARDANQALFGVERAVKLVRSRLAEEPDVVVQSLLDEVSAFTDGRQADDQTAMLLQVERPN
jgi:sigma-B regulation protein RsbU (phosphoserine phosphatase)